MPEMPTVSLDQSSTPPPPTYQDPKLLPKPRRCDAGAGIAWIRKAFDIFAQNAGVWLGMTFSIFVVPIILCTTPVVNVLAIFIVTLFIGGLIKTAAIQERGDYIEFEHLFSAFRTHMLPLIILTLLYIVGIVGLFIFSMLALVGLSFSNFLGIWAAIDSMGTQASASWTVLLFMSIACVFMMALSMSFWFAPALIVLHDVSPFKAIKMSVQASVTNWRAILVFGVMACFLGTILMMFTFGIVFIVSIPVMLLIYYTSYRDIWTDQPLSVNE